MSLAPVAGATIDWESRLADLLDPPVDTKWTPYPKQKIATELALEADETLFGGAAGPGKTEWGMRHVIEQMEMYPGNRGAIFRRVFPSLTKSVIPRLKLLLFKRAKWNGNDHTFTFPNDSVLELASLQYADSVLDFQGAEYGVIFFEEITEFLQSQWEYMLGRLRPPATMADDIKKQMRPHAIATTNPGGRGHRWVKRRWVKPDAEELPHEDERPDPGEVWRPRPSEENPVPTTRVYIPATHEDNPSLLENDPGYINRLRANSNRGLRLAMEKGDWDAIDQIEGALWSAEDLDGGRVNPVYYKRRITIVRKVIGVDPDSGGEGSDGYGIARCARGADGVGYVEWTDEWKNLSVRTLAKKTLDVYYATGADAIVLERNHGAKWLLEVFRKEDPYANIIDVWASDNKRTRAEPVSALFEYREDLEMPYRARMVGIQDEVEEEMTTTKFEPGELSPNKVDAVVWAMTNLMLRGGEAQAETMQDERLRGRR
jgi:hypothetical protein